MVADHPTDAYIYNDTSFNSEVFNVSENTEYPSIVPPGIPLPIGIRHHAPFGENQLLLRLLDYEGKLPLHMFTFNYIFYREGINYSFITQEIKE